MASVGLRAEEDTVRKQEELEHRIQRRMKEAECERELEVRKMMQQKLAGASLRNTDMQAGKEMEHRFRVDELQREAQQVQVFERLLVLSIYNFLCWQMNSFTTLVVFVSIFGQLVCCIKKYSISKLGVTLRYAFCNMCYATCFVT